MTRDKSRTNRTRRGSSASSPRSLRSTGSPRSSRAAATLALGLLLAVATGCSGELERAIDEGRTQAEQVVDEGRTQAERVIEEGRTRAERIVDEAEDAADAARETTGQNPASGSTQKVEVVRIIDGDTIEVSPEAAGGNAEVRFLAVDTPETHDETQPLGPQAEEFTQRNLEGQQVVLEYDEDRVDPYGRALAHVSVAGEERSIQEQLLARGYAQTAWFEPNDLHKQKLESIQQDARDLGVGIWGLQPGEQCELTSRGNGIGAGSPQCRG